jgi:cell division protein FtsA
VATRHRLRRQAPQILGLLDIGTSKTVCLIVAAARHGGAGDAELLGLGQHPSRGLKAGTVIELDAAEQCVRAAVTDAERAAGTELRQVLLAVACGRLKSTTFAADAKIGGRAVSEADIGRLLSAGRSYVERDGRALLHLNCVGYRLDGAGGIAAPHGLAGKQLSADLHAVSVDAAPLRNLVHAAERAYLSVTGLVPAPYASSLAATTAEERRAGVIALDFGAGTTGLALFADGHLLANDVIPVGGHHITFDIARALQISLTQAERIKAFYGTLDAAATEDAVLAVTPAGEDVPRLEPAAAAQVREVVRHRVTGLLGQIAERLERAGVASGATRHVVVTGGAAQLAGLTACVGAFWQKPARRGQAKAVPGVAAGAGSPALSTALGLAHVAFDLAAGVRRSERSFTGGGYLRSVGRWLQAGF